MRIVAGVLATITATLALAWFIIAASAAPAHADALCDAMRARFGPGYPCVSVPTNTFTPTAPAAPTTISPGGQSSGGPQVGSNIGPGPGEGNGTPIVPVPGNPNTTPGTNPAAPAATLTTPQVPAGPTQPGLSAPQATQRPPATTPSRPMAPSTVPAPVEGATNAPTQGASIPTTGNNSWDQTTQMLWLLGGAAAIVAGATTARTGGIGRYRAAATANGYPSVVSALRSWLPRGGAERFTVGPSQLVLINDATSPNNYVFHENVPPGGHISVNPNGTATIYNRDGQPVGHIAKPWAYDSLGRPQRTWYTVDNNGDLVQHIDAEPNALYPILADPTTSTTNSDGSVTTVATNEAGQVLTTATSTPVPDSGGSVDTTVQNADGTTSQGRSVPDGQGGVTTWTANPDGSHTVLYPDGTFYEEPAPGSGKGYTEGSTDGNTVNSNYTDPSGNRYNSTSTPDASGTVQTETETPQGHVSSQSDPTGKGEVVTTATTSDGQTVMTRTKPDGDGGYQTIKLTDEITGADGSPQYIQEDGKIFNPDAGKGLTSETVINPDGSSNTQYSDGSQLILRDNGTGEAIDATGNKTQFLPIIDPTTGKTVLIDPSTGEPADLSSTLSSGSTAIGAVGSAIERGGAALPTGTHHAGPTVSKSAVEKAVKIGSRWGAVGYALELGSMGVSLANGAPIPETVGKSAGAMAGGWGALGPVPQLAAQSVDQWARSSAVPSAQ